MRAEKMSRYRYQLVLQFSADSVIAFDHLVAFEERLIGDLGSIAKVDGHDFGGGEMNIFLLTDDPLLTAERAQGIRQSFLPTYVPLVACRELNGETYFVISPFGNTDFQIS